MVALAQLRPSKATDDDAFNDLIGELGAAHWHSTHNWRGTAHYGGDTPSCRNPTGGSR
jgi:hypothetical protein